MEDEIAIAFVNQVREAFPKSSLRADRLMAKGGFEEEEIEEQYTMWLSAFADITGEEMVAESPSVVEAHFEFFSRAYKSGSKEVRRLVDVDYVENLYWKIPKEVCALYWPTMPKNLQELYVGFHGKPPL